MSDFHDTPTHPVARKRHRCIGCCTLIPRGEKYTQQSGFYDGKAYRNRFHNECFEALSEKREFEFCPGDCEPPERLFAKGS